MAAKSFSCLQKQPLINPAAVLFDTSLFISNRHKMHYAVISTHLYPAGLRCPYFLIQIWPSSDGLVASMDLYHFFPTLSKLALNPVHT